MNKYLNYLIEDNFQSWSKFEGSPCVSKIVGNLCYTICLFGKGSNSFVSINVDRISGPNYKSNIHSQKVLFEDNPFKNLQDLYFNAKSHAEILRA